MITKEINKKLLLEYKNFKEIVSDKIDDFKTVKDIISDFENKFTLDKKILLQVQNITRRSFKLITKNKWDSKDYKEAINELRKAPLSNKGMLDVFEKHFKEKQTKNDIYEHYRDVYESQVVTTYLRIFDAKRRRIIDELYLKLDEIAKMTEGLKVLSDFFGRFWDLTISDLRYMDLSFIKRMQELLKKKKFIQKIAELLGRLALSKTEYEEQLIKEIKFVPSSKRMYKAPTNTIGITLGADIENILPHQFGYRHHPKLSLIFKRNFIENKLLEFERKDNLIDEIEVTRKERKLKEDNKGPFVICIDTSGSMHGEPETIAKAMAMALVNIAQKDKRKCFIYTFSTQITSFDATNLGESWSMFYRFLSLGASGGTDIDRAIQKAVEKTLEKGYTNADVIFISDLIINNLPQSTLEQIVKCKKKKVRFHSLTIGRSYHSKAVQFLDNNWIYDGSKESIDEITRGLEQIDKKKKKEEDELLENDGKQ